MKELQSRTVWTIIVMIGLSAFQNYGGALEPDLYMLVQTILGAFAAYFRINPKTNFSIGARNLVSKKKA